MEILNKEFKEKAKNFFKKNKKAVIAAASVTGAIILSTIYFVGWGKGRKAGLKESERNDISKFFKNLRIYEKTLGSWPVVGYSADTPIGSVQELSRWKMPLENNGIVTVGSLIWYVRNADISLLADCPGISDVGVGAVTSFLIRHTSTGFCKTYGIL